MTRTPDATTRRPPVASLRHLMIIALAVLFAMLASSTVSLAASHPVDLGDAHSFAVLAGTEVTNTGTTTITGDLGIYPGDGTLPNLTGDGTIVLTGTLHDADAEAAAARAALLTAMGDAAGRETTGTVTADDLATTLLPGVWDSAGGVMVLGAGETLTLDADDNPDAVWIIRASSGLTFFSDSTVSLINGANPCNVFWRVPSTATLGTGSTIVGTIMASTSITLADGATLQGRALAHTAEVTLIGNTITNADCHTASTSTTTIDVATGESTTTTSNGNGDGNGGDGNGDDTTSNGDGNGGDTTSNGGDDTTSTDDDGDAALPDDLATGDASPIEVPTIVHTGGGGTAAPSSQQGVLILLAVIGVGIVAASRHRFTNDA